MRKKIYTRQVGVLFSEDSLYTRQSPRSNLEFYSRLHQLPKQRVAEVLAEVGLADHAAAKVKKLSSSLVRRWGPDHDRKRPPSWR